MKTLLTLSLLIILSFSISAQELQNNRKTVVFHEAGYWCAEDYHTWPVGLYDTLCRVQNTAAFPAFYVEYDCFPVTTPTTDLMYTPANRLVGNTVGKWLNRPIMSVNFKGVLMDPNAYGDMSRDWNFATNKPIYKRPIDTLRTYVGREVSAQNVTAVGLSTTMLPNDSVVINTRVKFLSATSQIYTVVVFILEDSAMGLTNNGQAMGMQPHRYMLRYAGYDNVLGYAFNSGNPITKGQEFFSTFSKKIPTAWNKKHLSYLAITYRYDQAADHYDIDNATKGVVSTAVHSASLSKIDVSLSPNPAHNQLNLKYSFPEISQHADITLTDMSGRSISRLYSGAFAKEGTISLMLPELSSGVYMLRLNNEQGSIVKTVTIAE